MTIYYIYKIFCKAVDIKDIYVGNTVNFRNRKYRHKNNCINDKHKHYNYNIYKFIRENGGWKNWDMKVIEEYECDNSSNVKIREQYWINLLKANLNMRRTILTDDEKKILSKQYRETIKDKYKEYYINYNKMYYQLHKETILEKRKLNKQNNLSPNNIVENVNE